MEEVNTTGQNEDQQTADNPRQAGDFWLREIDSAIRREKAWRNEAVNTLKRYTLEGGSSSGFETANKFNILWSNTETLRNAVYNQAPKPDVRQRWETKDPTALGVAEMLDRALTYTIERSGFDIVARRAVLDYLLPGRAVVRARYVPEFIKEISPDEQQYDRLVSESVMFENVSWNDFCHSDAKTWETVEWVAFRHYIGQDDAKELFPDCADTMQYSAVPAGRDSDEENQLQPENLEDASSNAKACVWEIWDRRDNMVYWVSRGGGVDNNGLLKKMPPPLALEGFFPVCRPLYAVDQPDCLIPMPFYSQYKEQAQELDKVSARIKKMASVVKWRGLYDTSLGQDISRTLNEAEDGGLVPSDNAMTYLERGGLAGAIWLMPLQEAAAALQSLYQSRDQTKQTIYEITGISDILRGTSDPNETATAQALKAQWGSSRVDGMKREVQRFFRDLLAIAAEVIGETFQPDTLMQMTAMQFPSEQEKAMAQADLQRVQQMQQQMTMQAQAQPQGMPGAPMPPQQPKPQLPPEIAQQQAETAQKTLESPSIEDIMGVLRSDKMRAFRVDIETNSTIAPDQRAEMQDLNETMGMIGGLMQQVVPGIQSGVIPPPLAMALLTAVIRKTPLANEMSGILQQYEDDLAQGNPLQKQMDGLKRENEQLKIDNANKRGELQVKMMDVQSKAQQAQGQQQIDMADLQLRAAELSQRDQQATLDRQFGAANGGTQ